MEKILSVCIASYNKAEITTNLVTSLLTCKNPELEVVVVDNLSSDDTIAQLDRINDERLRVICNKINIGGAPNIAAALFAGNGRFCFYTNDRDIVYPEKINSFIAFLKDNSEIGGGHCVRNIIPGIGQFIEHRGVDGILEMSFRDEHPTGYFFRRSLLDTIPSERVKCYVNPLNYATFFWENFLCEIMCKGYTVVQYNDVIWRSTGNQTHSKYVSGFVAMDDEKDRWFYPDHCLRRVIGNTEDVFRIMQENDIYLNAEQRYKLYSHLIVPEYAFGVYRNKVIHETPSLSYHYKVTYRKIKKEEMTLNKRIITDGYIDYIREREGGYKELEKYVLSSIRHVDEKNRMSLVRYLSQLKRSLSFIAMGQKDNNN